MWRDADAARWPTPAGARSRPTCPASATRRPDPPGTWERHVEALERFRRGLGLERCVLVVHDWGGLIGLRWACEHPDAVRALVISSSGFFPDGKWHGMAEAMRTPRHRRAARWTALTREGFGGAPARARARHSTTTALDEYWKALRRRRRAAAARSSSTARATSRSSAATTASSPTLGVPTLLLWGETTSSRRVAGAHRFEREMPGAELVVIEGAGHFVWEDAPERCGRGGHAVPARTPRMERLFETTRPAAGQTARAGAATSRWPPACARRRSASSWARTTCSSAARRCARRSRRAARTR